MLATAIASMAPPVRADEPPLAERFLLDGRLVEGITALEARLATHPDDDQARFGLGVTQFLRAVERLGQSLHRHGALGPDNRLARMVPFLRLPVPPNPDPAEVSYADSRAMLAAFLVDLAAAEKTLAGIRSGEVSLPLPFGRVRLDLDGDGKAGEPEALWRMQAALAGPPRPRYVGATELPPPTDEELRRVAEAFALRLDRGDAFWLQGYCHLLSALGEFALAHDMEACFDVLAPRLFARPKVRGRGDPGRPPPRAPLAARSGPRHRPPPRVPRAADDGPRPLGAGRRRGALRRGGRVQRP